MGVKEKGLKSVNGKNIIFDKVTTIPVYGQ
jgi:hypothetical protein